MPFVLVQWEWAVVGVSGLGRGCRVPTFAEPQLCHPRACPEDLFLDWLWSSHVGNNLVDGQAFGIAARSHWGQCLLLDGSSGPSQRVRGQATRG